MLDYSRLLGALTSLLCDTVVLRHGWSCVSALIFSDLYWFEMAPVNPQFKGKSLFKGRNTKKTYGDSQSSAGKNKKKTWNPRNKIFQGSLQEGETAVFTSEITTITTSPLYSHRRDLPDRDIQGTSLKRNAHL